MTFIVVCGLHFRRFDTGVHMLYMFEVDALVIVVVFCFAGVFLLGAAAVSAVKDYVVARGNIRRIVSGFRREPFVISRTTSRTHEADSKRAA
jgi:hypothetical protein